MRLTQQSLPKQRRKNKNSGRFGWILWSLQLEWMALICHVDFIWFMIALCKVTVWVVCWFCVFSFCKLTSSRSDHPCVLLGFDAFVQSIHPTFQSTTAITSQSIPPTDAPLRVSKAINKERRKKHNEIPIGILIDFEWMYWIWCSFCLVTSPTATTNRTAFLEEDDDALQTLQCYHVHWRMYLFFMFCPCTHTQTNNNTINRHRQQLSRLWYDERKLWKEG